MYQEIIIRENPKKNSTLVVENKIQMEAEENLLKQVQKELSNSLYLFHQFLIARESW